MTKDPANPPLAAFDISFHKGLSVQSPGISRCLIPAFDGAILSFEWRDALWAKFCTEAPRRQRQSVERYNLQATIPHLTRSSLHRCLQRHGISRLPDVEGDKTGKKTFKAYPIGFFHVDIAEVQTAEGKLYLYVGIDRTSKFAFAELVEKANTVTARAFLAALVAAVPYKIRIVLTDNGIQFADLPKNRSKPTAMWRGHPFDRAC